MSNPQVARFSSKSLVQSNWYMKKCYYFRGISILPTLLYSLVKAHNVTLYYTILPCFIFCPYPGVYHRGGVYHRCDVSCCSCLPLLVPPSHSHTPHSSSLHTSVHRPGDGLRDGCHKGQRHLVPMRP